MLILAKHTFDIEIRGENGREIVEFSKLVDGSKPYQKTPLSKTWDKFVFIEENGVRLHNYKDKRVFIKDSMLYKITYLGAPTSWNCFDGIVKNDRRCVSIQSGNFSWEGTYLLEKRYQHTHDGECCY